MSEIIDRIGVQPQVQGVRNTQPPNPGFVESTKQALKPISEGSNPGGSLGGLGKALEDGINGLLGL